MGGSPSGRHLGELGASRQVLASAATRAESDARTSGGSPSTGPALLIVITVLLVISLIVGVSALLKVGSLETKITDLQAQIEPGTTARTDDELPAGNER